MYACALMGGGEGGEFITYSTSVENSYSISS